MIDVSRTADTRDGRMSFVRDGLKGSFAQLAVQRRNLIVSVPISFAWASTLGVRPIGLAVTAHKSSTA